MTSNHPAPQKSVLVVSYFYPPFQSVGALRVSKITKHLPEFGWRPVVLTVKEADLPKTMEIEIPGDSIHRAGAIDVNRLPKALLGRRRVAELGYHVARTGVAGTLLSVLGEAYRRWTNFPDGQIGWYPFAVRKGLEIIAHDRPSLIYSSALPATCHLVAHRLSALTGVPWIGEFRDPWTDNPNYARALPLRAIEREMERRVMATARALVAVTPARATQLAKRFGKRVATISNGYDRDDYPTGVPLLETFTITFTGMVYPGRQSARPLFDALCRLRAEGEVPAGFRVRLVGRSVDAIANEAAAAGVPELVETLPQVDRAAALRMQVESTGLLLLLWTSGDDAWYPAKMFEYLGAERPILAIGPTTNEAAQLLVRLGAGSVASDTVAVEAVLHDWFARYRAGGAGSLRGAPAEEEFERGHLVARLAALLDEVAAAATPPD